MRDTWSPVDGANGGAPGKVGELRILVNCLSSRSGGGVTYLRDLVPRLLARINTTEHQSAVVLIDEIQRSMLPTVPNEWVRIADRVLNSPITRAVWEARNLRRLVRREGIDVVFTPYQVAADIPGVRQVVMLRNMEPFLFRAYRYSPPTWLRNQVLSRRSVRCLRRADRVIAVSRYVAEHSVGILGIPDSQVRVIYHGRPTYEDDCDKTRNRREVGVLGIDGPFVLTCGSILPYRRCEDVIVAFERAAPSLTATAVLAIAGSGADRGYARMLRNLIARSPIRNRVRMLGHVSTTAMRALYQGCDALVVSTEIEACPNIALEALASGCAIISSDQPPLPEILENAALYYPARDVSALADRLTRVMRTPTLREDLRSHARGRSDSFSWERCAEHTHAALVTW